MRNVSFSGLNHYYLAETEGTHSAASSTVALINSGSSITADQGGAPSCSGSLMRWLKGKSKEEELGVFPVKRSSYSKNNLEGPHWSHMATLLLGCWRTGLLVTPELLNIQRHRRHAKNTKLPTWFIQHTQLQGLNKSGVGSLSLECEFPWTPITIFSKTKPCTWSEKAIRLKPSQRCASLLSYITSTPSL